jgi:hypothetical protein
MKPATLFLISFLTLAQARGAEGADIRIVFWFDRARPLDTFKFQSYDLRKKEFTPDVERWLAVMKKDYPGYDAYTRDIDLARERGQTDNLKIGSAILREFYLLGDRNGYTFLAPPPRLPAATRSAPMPMLPRVGPSPPRSFEPASSPSPFPVPYPRPHP